VLVGAAHAHLRVVARLAARPLAGVEVHWVTRGEQASYSGMLSGWVAGEYRREECMVSLSPLARAARVMLHPGGAVGLDAARRSVELEGGTTLEADVLSLGLGSGLRGAELPGVRAHALNVRTLLARWERFPALPGSWAVVGAGLGGVELALCLRANAEAVSLVVEDESFPPGASAALVRAVRRALDTRDVRVVHGRAAALKEDAVALAGGGSVPARAVLWATGPAPHPLLATSGLALGPTGAVRVDVALQSISHPNVFAAGDCADLPTAAPKSGVYSVREAPVLGHNLFAALRGEPLRTYRPQRTALALVNCGDGTALLSWGGLAARGRWIRRWKHWLDAGFLDALRRSAQRTFP
jgi:NADH dehydrogenase FAD-containing subunit